jgi:hypothetical protein
VQATVPVIGKRDATHRFRIPIQDGIINFKTLEDGLSDLENAFIDLNLRGEELVLARDIPLIPGFDKPIVSWRLSPDEVVLAESNRVRLQSLFTPILAESKQKDDKGKSRLKLHALDLNKIDITLDAQQGVWIEGEEGEAMLSLDSLHLAGRVLYDHEKTAPIKPTKLNAAAKSLSISLHHIMLGQSAIYSGELILQNMQETEATFHGLKPVAIRSQIQSIECKDLRF